LRYVAKWGAWLEWDAKCWRIDETRKVFSPARDLCREAANRFNKGATRRAIASAKTRAAVVSLASEDRRLAATIELWDADPWLLNTPGGVVDLRTGALRAHRPDDYMTKITAVAPDASPTPLWNAFLAKVTNGDEKFQKYLARVFGYCLTGITQKHALFFLFGWGGNGKGVAMNTIAGIMADYHRTAPIETFTESHQDRHPTELAMLRRARLVTSVETEVGRRWAESRIKTLTGGDPISARFIRQDFFEFKPQFKLMIAGNHKPGLRSVNEAIRRRLNLLPFTVKITEPDKELTNKLVAEWPGILAWMIDGCVAWQKDGLAPPAAVTQATEDYLQGEDAIKRWLEECCAEVANEWTDIGTLFHCWKQWAEASGEFAGSSKLFSQRLEEQGFVRSRTNKDRGFQGLTIFKPKTEQRAGAGTDRRRLGSGSGRSRFRGCGDRCGRCFHLERLEKNTRGL
jgi:putative DNA primase/helicase